MGETAARVIAALPRALAVRAVFAPKCREPKCHCRNYGDARTRRLWSSRRTASGHWRECCWMTVGHPVGLSPVSATLRPPSGSGRSIRCCSPRLSSRKPAELERLVQDAFETGAIALRPLPRRARAGHRSRGHRGAGSIPDHWCRPAGRRGAEMGSRQRRESIERGEASLRYGPGVAANTDEMMGANACTSGNAKFPFCLQRVDAATAKPVTLPEAIGTGRKIRLYAASQRSSSAMESFVGFAQMTTSVPAS